MTNVSTYRCTIYNAKNARKKCVVEAYHNGKYIYFSMVCHCAKIVLHLYGSKESIINYIKKYGQLLSQLTYALRVEEQYIFANIVECLDSVNRDMKKR